MKLLRGLRSGIDDLRLYRRQLLPGLSLWAPRCLASASDPQLHAPPQNLLESLSKFPSITVAKFPGAGRGLVASSSIKYGDTILMELPLLCYQSSSLADQVCYGCLMVLSTQSLHQTSPLSGRHFCSEACMLSCEARFHALESLALSATTMGTPGGDGADAGPGPGTDPDASTCGSRSSGPLSAFEALCVMNGERFPLLAARLAFTRLTRALTRDSRPPNPSTPQAVVASGDPVSDFNFLCFANVPKPYPEPWVQLHQRLSQALEAAVQAAERQLLPPPEAPQPQREQAQARAAALHAELERLSLDWFVSVLARLHINVFRVGCLLPQAMERSSGGQQQWLGPQMTSSGSASYLLASLFNHSCEPNVEVIFRRNDSAAAFVAARDIDEGEQLFVSYMDEGLPFKARQEHLMFSYGFKCRCQRCVEEEEDGAG